MDDYELCYGTQEYHNPDYEYYFIGPLQLSDLVVLFKLLAFESSQVDVKLSKYPRMDCSD